MVVQWNSGLCSCLTVRSSPALLHFVYSQQPLWSLNYCHTMWVQTLRTVNVRFHYLDHVQIFPCPPWDVVLFSSCIPFVIGPGFFAQSIIMSFLAAEVSVNLTKVTIIWQTDIRDKNLNSWWYSPRLKLQNSDTRAERGRVHTWPQKQCILCGTLRLTLTLVIELIRFTLLIVKFR